MIPVAEVGLLEPVYTFVTSDGTNVHIASGRLAKWVTAELAQGRLEISLAPLEEELARRFIRDNSVSAVWCKTMFANMLKTGVDNIPPIIYCDDGSFEDGHATGMVVDGHHRYVCLVMLGCKLIRTVHLSVGQWKAFQITGLPDFTHEEIVRSPVIKVVGA